MEESNSQTVCPAESHFVEAKTRLANYVRDLLVRNGFYIFLEVLFKKKKENMWQRPYEANEPKIFTIRTFTEIVCRSPG